MPFFMKVNENSTFAVPSLNRVNVPYVNRVDFLRLYGQQKDQVFKDEEGNLAILYYCTKAKFYRIGAKELITCVRLAKYLRNQIEYRSV